MSNPLSSRGPGRQRKSSIYNDLNKGPNCSKRKNQKLQSTVRFEAEIYSTLEELQEESGCSFAEVVRKLVRNSLERKKYL